MKSYFTLIPLAFSVVTLFGVANAAPTSEPSKQKIIATVNGHDITEWTLMRYAKQRGLPPEMSQEKRRQALIEELINRTLIYQNGVDIGIDKTPVIQDEIEYQRINVIASTMISRSSDRFTVSDADMKKEYENRKEELGGKELKARHILLEEEQQAKDIIAELDKGADFLELASKHLTGPSALNGGDLGWFNPDQMVKPFSQSALTLKKGSYSSAPVKTQFGWHIILLEDTRSINPPKYEDIKEQIKVGLQSKLIGDYISGLRSKAKIEKR